MLSKATIKFINSLQIKKYRALHQAFVVEGAKSMHELLRSDFEIEQLYVTDEFFQRHNGLLNNNSPVEIVTENQLVQAGSFSSNNAGIAIVKMKKLPALDVKPNKFTLVLDDIRDPGNLGTIIRIADWYGISTILCSETCADFYNPKTITSTMGSFTRVNAYYLNLPEFLHKIDYSEFSVYGASLHGGNIHAMTLKPEGLLIMGNEAHGISPEVSRYVTKMVKIHGYGGAESLNVATATAILVDNFFRNT